jgi:hypothetical protein
MVQPSDFGSRHDWAHPGRLDGSHVGGILVKRKMSSCAVVVREVTGQDAAQVPVAKDET